jgi:hypothetical protein
MVKEDYKVKKTELTAEDFKAMVAIGAERLSENAEYVNSLNVFVQGVRVLKD